MQGKMVLHIYYHDRENIFTDDDGHVIYDLFDIITPQDLFLFRFDPGFNCFPVVGDPDVLCEIIIEPGEDCGSPDLGDDEERIGRMLTMYKDLAFFERTNHKYEHV